MKIAVIDGAINLDAIDPDPTDTDIDSFAGVLLDVLADEPDPFELDNGRAAAEYPPSVSQDPDAPEPSAEPTAEPDSGEATTTGTSDDPPWALIGTTALVLLAAAAGAVAWIRRRSSSPARTEA